MNADHAFISVEVVQRRLERERRARREAESLLESKSRELYEANLALMALARTDPLTRLLNRRAFLDDLRLALCDHSRPLLFALVDLDGFRRVNELYGQQVADLALAGVAERLQARLSGAKVARWGGDQFAICAQVGERGAAVALLQAAADAITAELTILGRSLQLRNSIGAALAPDHAKTADELERLANNALASAKVQGGGQQVLFNDALRASLDLRWTLERDLRGAIKDREISAWFQPIMDIDRRRLTSLEALARWRTDAHGFVPPSTFLPLASELGLLSDLDFQLATQALVAARRWVADGLVDTISLNISPHYVNDGRLTARIESLLDTTGLPPSALMLELTEDAVFEDLKRARHSLEELTQRGVRFSLDDFGSGYSNLRVLADLPLSAIKLDRSLVSEIETDMEARTLLGAVVHLAKTLRLTVVAEGVETETQALILRILGVDRVQGFLYGRAMPEDEILACFSGCSAGVAKDPILLAPNAGAARPEAVMGLFRPRICRG